MNNLINRNIYIPKDTFLLHMIQICSIIKVLEIFFKEPTTIHFIREISKKIDLAPTSVKNHITELNKSKLIIQQKSKPFNGYIANRENEKFLFYKKVYNLFSLYGLKEEIINNIYPKAIILFGSYSLGEDIESSDIDLVIISKIKKNINLKKIENHLKRRINLIIIEDINKLDSSIINKVYNGITLHGTYNG